MFSVGLSEILIIVLVGILLFGRELPDVARFVGRFVRKIQQELEDIKNDIDLEP